MATEGNMQQKVSILFAGEAEELLEKGDSSAALQLCKTAIATYKEYPMGLYMAAVASFEEDDRDSALDFAERGLAKFPNYLPLLSLRNLIEDTAIIADIAEEFSDEEIIEDEKSEGQDTQTDRASASVEYAGENKKTSDEKANFLRLVNTVDNSERIENQLRADNLALIPGLSFTPLRATRRQQFSDYTSQSVRFPDFYNTMDVDSGENVEDDELGEEKEVYATDTMANILESQQAFDEAIKIYSILKETNPEKEEYYTKKIEEISKKLKN